MSNFNKEYAQLNAEQKDAVDTIDGPLLVIAGPGTGKTQLLSLRVANILKKTDAAPGNILCLTFTESGKKAMLDRLAQLIGGEAQKVEINTFHSFGVRLFTRFSKYFPELTNSRAAEDLSLYETLNACMEQLPRNNPLSKRSYGEFVYQESVKERISQLKRAGILPQTALKMAKQDLAWSDSVGRKLAGIFTKTGGLSSKSAKTLAPQLEPMFKETPSSKLGQICFSELSEALENFGQTGKTTLLTAFKKKWFSSEKSKQYFKPSDQLKKLVALAQLYDDYETALKQRGLFDYDDMILFALEKLNNEPKFLAEVQETFQYILADEYQDTNAAQASIINLIANSRVHEGRPNVMVVGDDDQAIYGFQGALGDVLIDFRERWRNVKVVTLKQNYRSTPSILEAARTVIIQGENRLENYYKDIDKSLSANLPHKDTPAVMIEASSPHAVLDKALYTAKSGGAEQLAIIASKHKYLHELADKLDAAGVSYYYEGREDILKNPEVQNLLLLSELCLLLQKKQLTPADYLLAETIAKQLLPIPKQAAWHIALGSKTKSISWWEQMLASEEPAVKTAIRKLSGLVDAIDVKDAEATLKIVARTFGLRVNKKVKLLQSNAVKYYGRSEVSLRDVLNYTRLCIKAKVPLQQTVSQGTEQSNVVLLSAHKSKGLEYDRVLVLHADYHTWFKERGRGNILTLPENWKYLEPPQTAKDDRLRLLYVVLTRARKQLALVRSAGTDQALPEISNMELEQHIVKDAGEPEVFEDPEWRLWYLPATDKEKAALSKLLKPLLENYKLSPTHLTTFLDVAHGGPGMFFAGVLLGVSEPVHADAVFGSRIHKTLHFAQKHLNETGKLPTKHMLKTYLQKEILHITQTELGDISETAYNFMSSSNFLKKGGVGEYSFSSQSLEQNGVRLTGTVDNYVLDKHKLTIIDYKTGSPLDSWHATEDYYKQKLHRFAQQLMFYEYLFKLSGQFKSTRQIVSKIAFVEPDKRGKYHVLDLQASQKEYAKLQTLIAAAWGKITDLDLPDTSVYSKNMQGILDFEKYLIDEHLKKRAQ